MTVTIPDDEFVKCDDCKKPIEGIVVRTCCHEELNYTCSCGGPVELTCQDCGDHGESLTIKRKEK